MKEKYNCQLIQTRKEIKDEKTGEVKRFTNFKLRFEVGNRYIDIPIRPVDFGQESNRRNYTLLISIADKLDKQDKNEKELPF